MTLPIIKLPTPSLRQRSVEITLEELASEKIQSLIDDMIPTMYGDDGIGLAAPQVAQNIRICIIGKAADKSLTDDLVLINPAWTKNSKKTAVDDEGCLSVPGKFGKVRRFTDVHVDALDRKGNTLSFDARKFFARVVQHEVDHLNGVLFIDKASDIYEVDPLDVASYKSERANKIQNAT